MNPLILSHIQRIDNSFSKISNISDPATQSEWARYLCVLVSGFIEQSLRVLLTEYSDRNSAPYVRNFISEEIRRLTNCKTSKIEEILRKFHSRWAEDFTTQISDAGVSENEIKDSIDSVVAIRHAIAHGKNTGISYITISKYYSNAKAAVNILESIIA